MEKMVQSAEDSIKFNFFGLDYSSQIKIMNLYLERLDDVNDVKRFKEIFGEYIVIINKFIDFKSKFYMYDNSYKNGMREMISSCRKKINHDIGSDCVLKNSYQKFDNDFVKEYIRDSYSYSKDKMKGIVLDFLDCYSFISRWDFDFLLMLCGEHRDFFNSEIKSISNDFYSLYLSMDVVSRMKYIWYLCQYEPFELRNRQALSKYFKIESSHEENVGSKNDKFGNGKSKTLSKYFKRV